MQAFGDIRNPYGQTEALSRALERVMRLCFTEGVNDVTADLVFRAILEDPECEGARAFLGLGVTAIAAPEPTPPSPPRRRADVAMIRFSSGASDAMGLAAQVAQGERRPTSTGHLCSGLVEADDALRGRLSVTAEAYRIALQGVDREQ